jgi:hypothetical protein
MKVEDVSLEPASAFQPFLALQTVKDMILFSEPTIGTHSVQQHGKLVGGLLIPGSTWRGCVQ